MEVNRFTDMTDDEFVASRASGVKISPKRASQFDNFKFEEKPK